VHPYYWKGEGRVIVLVLFVASAVYWIVHWIASL
jgi:hypothetical protein